MGVLDDPQYGPNPWDSPPPVIAPSWTTRDEFAKAALTGLAANKNVLDVGFFRDLSEGVRAGKPLASAAYAIADAMLAARERS